MDSPLNKPISRSESGLEKIWVVGMLHMVLLLLVVFIAEVSTVQADGLFDFQMKLAEKGNAEAQLKVGGMYETGFGVEKNMKAARNWVNKAAAQGNETAGFKLLYWDMQKNGLKGDNKKKYAEMVGKAEAGDGFAMYYVALVYANGTGLKVNFDKSLEWLNKATLVGILEAEREVEVVREQQRVAKVKARKDQARRKAKAEADKKAKIEADKRKQAEAKRKQAEQMKQQAEQKKAAAAAASDAEKQAEDARILAERKAKAAQNERKRQALLKKKAEDRKNKKDEFESDPCAGKSARFLSTCR